MSGGFENDIIGGGAALVRAAIKSPNFVHGVSGWSINKDGSAEFQSIIIPPGSGGNRIFTQGTTPASPNTGDLWINTSSGNEVSVWNGSAWTPYQWGTSAIGPGSITAALIAANTITAGQLAAGIVYAGIVDATTVQAGQYVATGSQGEYLAYTGTPAANNLVASVSGFAGTDSHGNTFFQGITNYFNAGPGLYVAANIQSGSFQVFTATSLAGPWSTAYFIQLNTDAQFGSNTGIQLDTASGHNVIINLANLVAGDPSNTSTAETWHNATPPSGGTLGTWTGTLRYRLMADNSTRIQVNLTASPAPTASQNITLFTLPSGYRPVTECRGPWASAVVGQDCQFQVSTAGAVVALNVQSGQTRVAFNIDVPLD